MELVHLVVMAVIVLVVVAFLARRREGFHPFTDDYQTLTRSCEANYNSSGGQDRNVLHWHTFKRKDGCAYPQ